MPVANARMYSAAPAAKRAWRELLGWALGRAGLDWEILDYDAPAPLASYYHDLLAKHDPDLAARVRVIATTPAAPIPPLVATAALAPDELGRLRAALAAVAGEPELAGLRDALLLAGFAVPAPADYDVLDDALAASRRYAGVW